MHKYKHDESFVLKDSCYLSKHEGSFCELHDHFLCIECIIQLEFEVLDLGIRIYELDESRFQLRFGGV
jgi:hypothetical protein